MNPGNTVDKTAETVFTEDMTNTASAKLAETETSTLITSLLTLDAKATRTQEDRIASAWISEEIERRYPEVGPAMEAWSEDTEPTLTYAEALLLALPAEVVG